jgi:hypothetical protein
VDLTSLPAERISAEECGFEHCCGGHLRLNALDNSTLWCEAGAAAGCHSEPVSAPSLDWVVAGGESGPGARPMHPDWARSLRDQCAAAGVPFLFKQWGEWRKGDGGEAHFKEALTAPWRRVDSGTPGTRYAFMVKAGKRDAGRLLDGVLHDAYPEPHP